MLSVEEKVSQRDMWISVFGRRHLTLGSVPSFNRLEVRNLSFKQVLADYVFVTLFLRTYSFCESFPAVCIIARLRFHIFPYTISTSM